MQAEIWQLIAHTDHITLSEDVRRYFDELRIKLGYRMSSAFLLVFIALTYAYSFDSPLSCITMSFGVLLSLFNILYIHFTKKYQLVFWLYSILGVVVTSFALLVFHETVHLVDVLWMLAGVSLAFFSIGRKFGMILLIYSLLVITVFIFHSLNIHIETVKPRTFYQQLTLVFEMITGFGFNFYLFYLFTNVYRYSENKLKEVNQQLIEQNMKIQQQNDEKTTLVKEIHHRVKNNLQIVVSLLRLQSSEIDSEEMRKHFQESINRVMAMALIHQKLYQNESLSQVKFADYATDLVTTILQTDAEVRRVDFKIHSEIDKVGLKSLIPIGLILNELVSNSLKHAFKKGQTGQIDLKVERGEDKNWLNFIYHDNGRWKQPFTPRHSFGMVLVETLTEQLDGNMIVEKQEDGTTFILRLQNIVEPDIVA